MVEEIKQSSAEENGELEEKAKEKVILILDIHSREENKTNQAQDPTYVDNNPEEPQALQGQHRKEDRFIAVGTRHSLFNFTVVHVIDDVQVCSYHKEDEQLVFNEAWVTEALGKDYIEYKKKALLRAQMDFSWFFRLLIQNDTQNEIAPEVTVTRHDAPDGRVTFNCIATGFYPRSIQLLWKKDEQLGVWGQESSSGTLPNADSTFYLQITLELPPGDSGTGYSCVVEHTKLQKPAVYPVPEKPSVKRPWGMALGLLTIIMLVLGCVGAFIIWKKKKTGTFVLGEWEN
ncbi:HLA class I histocompatibility antigen, alpha chain F-like [Antechinus flavipes]|uniref:HLA class I histocompatibility antigen, alpha chain F-like n=1 Tax=Antechinus flavipes TaxID=38775 RepID=UPI002235765C|nr:HLA class I histocompatibility antigen, alpha chain F-like [Antechinus flavipes]